MNKIVVDNSVVVKWFYKENDSDKALELLDLVENLGIALILPSLTILELINSLRFGKKTNSAKADEVIKKFFSLEPEFLPVNLKSSLRLSFIVQSNNITSYDAVYISVAEEKNIPLFTADYKHHQKSISKKIVWLKEWKGKL